MPANWITASPMQDSTGPLVGTVTFVPVPGFIAPVVTQYFNFANNAQQAAAVQPGAYMLYMQTTDFIIAQAVLVPQPVIDSATGRITPIDIMTLLETTADASWFANGKITPYTPPALSSDNPPAPEPPTGDSSAPEVDPVSPSSSDTDSDSGSETTVGS